MALINHTDSAISQKDFLSKFHAWINGGNLAGWTVAEYITNGSVPGRPSDDQLSVRMGTECYFHFITRVADASVERMEFAASVGFSAGSAWNQHPDGYSGVLPPGYTQAFSVPKTGQTFTFYFIGDSSYLWIVFSMDGGWWQIAFVGKLDVFPGLADEAFYSEGMVPPVLDSRYDYNSPTHAPPASMLFAAPASPPGFTAASGALHNPDGGAWTRANQAVNSLMARHQFVPSLAGAPTTKNKYTVWHPQWDGYEANLVQPLVPCVVFAPRVAIADKVYAAGTVPGAFYTPVKNIGEAYAGTAKLVVGTDSYWIFPAGKTLKVAHPQRYSGLAIKVPA